MIALRTRPPLEGEINHFDVAGEDDEGAALPPLTKDDFCSGITVTSANPGVMVAHVPGSTVRHDFAAVCRG